MLLPDNIHPENTLIFNGALVIRALKKLGAADLLDLYLESKGDSNMSMPLFVLSLDWLYLTDSVEFNEQGRVVLCS